jgi:hypothetical protein
MTDHKNQAECERYGGGLSVQRAFVTLIEPGKIANGKGPFLTSKHLWEFVRECVAQLPPTTQIIVHELTWDDQLWTQCGREMITIDAMLDTVERG